jgi:hypothetical protein
MNLNLRLSRVEASLRPQGADDLRHLTGDELSMRLWDVSRKLLASERLSEPDRSIISVEVGKIEAGIVAQARMRAEPSYARHLAIVQGSRPYYVPAICGLDGMANSMTEYHDLHTPDIMERRAAIFARPDVQALIARAGTPDQQKTSERT